MSPSSGLIPTASENGYNTILFDLDGTLVDSLPALTNSLNVILAEDKLPTLSQDDVVNMVGDGINVLVKRAYTAAGQDPSDDDSLKRLVTRFNTVYGADPSAGCSPFPFVAEIITGLIGLGYKVGVVTNKHEAPARTLLQKFSLMSLFEVLVGGDTTPHLKPHPEPFLHAADQLGVSPHHVIMVGDSINDIEGARRAGMRGIAAAYGYTQMPVEDFKADAVISSLIELPKAIQKLPQDATLSS